MAFIAIADGLSRLGWSAADLRWLYAVKVGAVVAALWWYRRCYTELAAPRWQAGPALAAIATGVLVLVLWVSLDAGWMSIGEAAGFDPRTDGRIDWLMVAVRIAGAALVVPLMEELFWRSFLLRWIDHKDFLAADPARVKSFSIIVTVILFGFEHNLWLAGIVAGVAYTLLYMRTGSLWWPILAHAVTNGMLGAWVVLNGQWTYW
jgi:CAAX prenyl protease-like protein